MQTIRSVPIIKCSGRGGNKNSRNQPKQQFLTEENSAQILQKDGLPSIQNQSSANLEISSKDNSALINK